MEDLEILHFKNFSWGLLRNDLGGFFDVHDHGGGFLSESSRFDDHLLVILELLDPGLDIGGGIVQGSPVDSGMGAEHPISQLGHQFLKGIVMVTEQAGQVPVKAALMAGRMDRFMEQGGVVCFHGFEIFFVGHLDFVQGGRVASPIPAVGNFRHGLVALEDFLTLLNRHEIQPFLNRGLNPLTLIQIENSVVFEERDGFGFVLVVELVEALDLHGVPENDSRSLFALLDRSALGHRLLVGEPIAAFELGHSKDDQVDSLIRGLGDEIAGKAGSPGLAPRDLAFFEGGQNLVGNHCGNVKLFHFVLLNYKVVIKKVFGK